MSAFYDIVGLYDKFNVEKIYVCFLGYFQIEIYTPISSKHLMNKNMRVRPLNIIRVASN